MRFPFIRRDRVLLSLAAFLLSLASLHAIAQDSATTPALRARQAPVFSGGPADTREADLARWGLTRADMSLLDDEALARKAGLPGRAEDLAAAAKAGGAIAAYLSGLHAGSLGQTEAADEAIRRAAQVGIVRAVAVVLAAQYQQDTGPGKKVAYDNLVQVASWGSAYAAHALAYALLVENLGPTSKAPDPKRMDEAVQLLQFSAEAGHAPAQLEFAKLLWGSVEGAMARKEAFDPEHPRLAQRMLDRAVAQGHREAIAFAKTRQASAPASAAQATMAQATPTPRAPGARTPAAVARAAPVLLVDTGTPPPVDLARWGLTAADMSLLDDAALIRKGQLTGRRAQLDNARGNNDPVAAYLSSIVEMALGDRAKAKDAARLAVKLGVVRALTARAVNDYFGPDTPEALEQLRRSAATGSAFSAYALGNALVIGNMGSGAADKRWVEEATKALTFAAEAGYAPAELYFARRAFSRIDGGETDPKLRQQAQMLLDRAVAQGHPEAIEFAATRKGR